MLLLSVSLLVFALTTTALARRLQPEAACRAYFAEKVGGQTAVIVRRRFLLGSEA